MTHDWSDNRKNLMLFSAGPPELAEQVAKELDVNVTTQTARDFANGEIFVRFDESVRGCDAFVLQSHPPAEPVGDGATGPRSTPSNAAAPSASRRSCRSTPCPSGQRSTAPRTDLRRA